MSDELASSGDLHSTLLDVVAIRCAFICGFGALGVEVSGAPGSRKGSSWYKFSG